MWNLTLVIIIERNIDSNSVLIFYSYSIIKMIIYAMNSVFIQDIMADNGSVCGILFIFINLEIS